MTSYNYILNYEKLLQPDILRMVSQIHEYKGRQDVLLEIQDDILSQLIESAQNQSIEASGKISGIDVFDERLTKLVKDKVRPKTNDEKEIAGYRDVSALVNEDYNFIPVKTPFILQLYRDLYKYMPDATGRDKIDEKCIEYINTICNSYDDACKNGNYDSLLLIPMFILDFLCIHPFEDGNGRMSWLLTLLLLNRSGYVVGKYISIETLIEQTKELYYKILKESSVNWGEENNNYEPFVRYMLQIVISAYCELFVKVNAMSASGVSKPERIREIIKNQRGEITKTELLKKCLDISQTTVQRTLNELVKNREILKIGGGRYTTYVWNQEEIK